jgi:hypothetical protein
MTCHLPIDFYWQNAHLKLWKKKGIHCHFLKKAIKEPESKYTGARHWPLVYIKQNEEVKKEDKSL